MVGIAGPVVGDNAVKRELTRSNELQDRDGCEHFVHRAEGKLGIDRVFDFLITVGQAPGSIENGMALPRNQNGPGKLVFRLQIGGVGADLCHKVVPDRFRPGVRSGCGGGTG